MAEKGVSCVHNPYSNLKLGSGVAPIPAMLRAGADHAATGENAVVVGCRRADLIVGPVGIAIADALWGEITPAMALAVGQSRARRLLLPMNHCENLVLGVRDLNLSALVQEAVERAVEFAGEME